MADKLRADLEPRQRAVNAAVRDFLGGPEIRRAQEYVTAVQQIGGATALVEADQRKVNRALAEALQHYSKLGEQAPQAMIDLEAATRTVDVPMRAAQGSADRLWSSLRNIAGTIGIAFSAGAL
ncbi:MAG: hypothetical protein OEW98_00005, partial [Betaproteobacteria bacterium]|nr:hypothetical protein [Betaproteobacteria bacterium]